jgi:regulator of cell morphogenesis and NO signaling
MNHLDTSVTVGQLVARQPAHARVFERLGIDYCCGGKKTLAEACAAKGLDAPTVAAMLGAVDAGDAPGGRDWTTAPLAELAEHIVRTHHVYLRSELPRLTQIVNKVAAVHGDNHPELHEVRSTFQLLRAELEEHMMKEERILFPLIAQIDAGTFDPATSHCGIERPIQVMEHEHENAGNALTRLRQLTGGYAVPDGACNTYRVMLASLAQLEADMHQHVHKENNILFPRALEARSRLGAACGA